MEHIQCLTFRCIVVWFLRKKRW